MCFNHANPHAHAYGSLQQETQSINFTPSSKQISFNNNKNSFEFLQPTIWIEIILEKCGEKPSTIMTGIKKQILCKCNVYNLYVQLVPFEPAKIEVDTRAV